MNANSQTACQTYSSETLDLGPRSLCSGQPPGDYDTYIGGKGVTWEIWLE